MAASHTDLAYVLQHFGSVFYVFTREKDKCLRVNKVILFTFLFFSCLWIIFCIQVCNFKSLYKVLSVRIWLGRLCRGNLTLFTHCVFSEINVKWWMYSSFKICLFDLWVAVKAHLFFKLFVWWEEVLQSKFRPKWTSALTSPQISSPLERSLRDQRKPQGGVAVMLYKWQLMKTVHPLITVCLWGRLSVAFRWCKRVPVWCRQWISRALSSAVSALLSGHIRYALN